MYIINPTYLQNVLPHSRDNGNLSILSLPNGKARYAACVRYHCDEDIDPEVIHQIGLQEVEKTKTKIQQVCRKLKATIKIQLDFTMAR